MRRNETDKTHALHIQYLTSVTYPLVHNDQKKKTKQKLAQAGLIVLRQTAKIN